MRWHRQLRVRLRRQWLTRRQKKLTYAPAEGVSLSRDSNVVTIVATSVESVYAHDVHAQLDRKAQGLKLDITHWRAPRSGWSGRIGFLPRLEGYRLKLPDNGSGPATVELSVAAPASEAELLRAALSAVEPWRPLPTAGSPAVVVDGKAPAWLRLAAEHPGEGIVPHDLSLAWTGFGVAGPDGRVEILVDPVTANPQGRQGSSPTRLAHRLEIVPADGEWRWSINGDRPGTAVASGRAGHALDRKQQSALRGIVALEVVTPVEPVPGQALASILAQLAMTGVIVSDPALSPDIPLAADLAALIRLPIPALGADPMEWEMRSVDQRRAAHRSHSPGLASSLMRQPPSVSAVLVTRRPQYAQRAIRALKAQTYLDLEIVVALHGCEPESLGALDSGGREMTLLAYPGSMPFGAVLAAACERAGGTLLTKVDDDDIYGPEHVWDLVLARSYKGATVVGKSAEFVHLSAHNLTVRRHVASECYTDAVAGGTMLLSRGDLESVGGWRPVARSVDRGLLDRVLINGGLVYSTHAVGFIYVRHAEGHTWDPGVEHFLLDVRQKWDGLPPYSAFGGDV